MTTQQPAVASTMLVSPLGRALLATLYVSLIWGTAQATPHPAAV